jgi:hypothetical protein
MKYLSLILFFFSFVASGQKNEADTTSSKQLEEVEQTYSNLKQLEQVTLQTLKLKLVLQTSKQQVL